MNTKTLLSAFAMAALLSCQNQPDPPAAPQGETGSLALRIVSSKALAEVESVSVRLSWSDIVLDRKATWGAPSIKLDGLPLGVRIGVHMEGWNAERGRKVLVWSGDAYAVLGGDTNWDMNNEAPIVIVPAAPAASPNLAKLLPAGYALAGDSLRLLLPAGKADTIRIDSTGIDSVLLEGTTPLATVGGKFQIILAPGASYMVVVVGSNGMTSTFRAVAFAKLPSARELVPSDSARSWSNDTLSFSLPSGTSENLVIDTLGVDTVFVNGTSVQATGTSYQVSVQAPGNYTIVAKGTAGQSIKFTVLVWAIQKAEVKPGLGADFKPALPTWVGTICSLRVAMDSGVVDSVVMLKPERVAFAKVTDSLWKLDWTTKGSSDSIEVHVYGKGSKGTDSVMLGKKLSFDRAAPSIRVAGMTNQGFLFGRAGGVVSWKASDRGVASSWATDAGNAKVTCDLDTCLATEIRKSFAIHARDNLGNDTSLSVSVTIDSVGPKFTSVKDAAEKSFRIGDTLWIDSAVGTGAIFVSATDDHSGIVIVAERASPQGSIQERIASGSATVAGLTAGVWVLRASDDLGNGTPWGNLVVAIRPSSAIVKLEAYLQSLPTWVAASCSVKVVRTSGTIDTVLASGLRFKPNSNKSEWSASWTPSKSEGQDSLKITVQGQGSKGSDSVSLLGIVSVDRKGPTIVRKSELRNGALWVGRNGGELAVSVEDDRGVDSVWFKGTTATITKSDSIYRGTVTGSVTVMARDSLGNVDTLKVNVVQDTTAPKVGILKDGSGHLLASGAYVHRDTGTGVAKLVVTASDSSGFLVALSNVGDGVEIRRTPASSGEAVLDSLPAGTFTVVIEDSLGNKVVGNGDAWGTVIVRPLIAKPMFSRPAGTYGADSTIFAKFMNYDALTLKVTCSNSGATPIFKQSSSTTWESAQFEYVWINGAFDFRCATSSDTSLTDRRTYNVLQRPWIKMNDSSFTSSSLTVEIARDSGLIANPAQATIQYCIGDSAKCLAVNATWSDYNKAVEISTATILWARIFYDGKYSHISKRTYTKAEKNLAWGLDFGKAAYDTTSIRTIYGGVVWSLLISDTIKANMANGLMSINAKWLTEGRGANQWSLGGITIPLDLGWATYDFSKVDSITFDYKTSGTLDGLYFYPVHKDDNDSCNGPQYFVLTSTGNNLNHVTFGTEKILTPAWGGTPITWPAIRNSIKAIRFGVAPATSGGGLPTGPSGAVTIDNVNIYGIITKN